MKYQQVDIDYWTMGKTMMMYVFLAVLVWIMLRLFQIAVLLPRRLRAQQDHVQDALKQLQEKYPDLNITQEDLDNLEADVEKMLREEDQNENNTPTKEKNALITEEPNALDTKDNALNTEVANALNTEVANAQNTEETKKEL